MMKMSAAQTGQMMKMAADELRALSVEKQALENENIELKTKVAHFEKKARAEGIAHRMEEKGINSDASLHEKVAGLMQHDNLDVMEEAVGLAAPQTKLASVHEDGRVSVEGGSDDLAASQFASNLLML